MRTLVLAGFVLGSSWMNAQQGTLGSPATKPKQYVTFAAEEQTVKAAKKSVVSAHRHRPPLVARASGPNSESVGLLQVLVVASFEAENRCPVFSTMR